MFTIEELERQTRIILATLRPTETLSSGDLVSRLIPLLPEDTIPRDIYNGLAKIASRALSHTVPTLMEKGPYKGRTVNARRWHHIDSPAMPHRPISQSQGAAGPAASLVDRVQRVEDWITQRDPLFRVL